MGRKSNVSIVAQSPLSLDYSLDDHRGMAEDLTPEIGTVSKAYSDSWGRAEKSRQ